jgi:hypothetical protein
MAGSLQIHTKADYSQQMLDFPIWVKAIFIGMLLLLAVGFVDKAVYMYSRGEFLSWATTPLISIAILVYFFIEKGKESAREDARDEERLRKRRESEAMEARNEEARKINQRAEETKHP